MNDIQIKMVCNGWVVTDRYGSQFAYTDPLSFIESIATRTLSMEQRNSIIIKNKDEHGH